VVDSILGSAGKQADGLECKAHLLFNILMIEAEGGFGVVRCAQKAFLFLSSVGS
jgi:hypothetical protein